MGDNFKNQIKILNNKLAVVKHENFVLSGKDFKTKYNVENKFFMRYMNDNMTHYGFVYKEGLNEDTVPFNPTGNCNPGGLYFTTAEHIRNHLEFKGGHIRLVEIPDDAKVYVFPLSNKWKADKIIIGEKISIKVFEIYEMVKNIKGFFD